MAHALKAAVLPPRAEPAKRQAGTARNGPAVRGGSPTVAVVICAYTEERWNELVFAVTSVLQQTYRAAEILVVIDHNPELLRRATFELRGVAVITNENGIGLSGARNTGVRAATADVVAFLDDDAFAAPNWLAAHAAAYADPDVLGVGGRVVPAWRSGRPAWFPPEFDWVVGCSYHGMPVKRTPLRNYIGTNMSLRRELLLESGGWDGMQPRTGLQRRSGFHLYEPAAMVRLGVPGSLCTWSHFRSRCFSTGMSKALVSGPVGSRLAVERSYLRSVIPKGIGRSVVATLRGDVAAAREALVLAAGVVITSTGYLIGWSRAVRDGLAQQRQPARRPAPPSSLGAAPSY